MEARKSQIATTIEQSKRLLAAGIDPESADMCYIEEIITNGIGCISYKHTWSEYPIVDTHEEYEGPEPVSLPAWSLSRLIDLIAETGIPMNYGPMKDSASVLDHAVNALEYQLLHANH